MYVSWLYIIYIIKEYSGLILIDLQEVGGTLSGFGLWSPEVTVSQIGNVFSSAPRA